MIRQIQAVIEDIPPAAGKTGALGNVEIIEAVAALAATFGFPLVVDPVMVSKHGARLLAPDAVTALRHKLLPRALLVTPNLPEAEALTGRRFVRKKKCGLPPQCLFDLGCPNVLIKGGHLPGQPVDLLYSQDRRSFFRRYARRNPPHPWHRLRVFGRDHRRPGAWPALEESVAQAKDFVQRAIETAPRLGAGNGPLKFNTSAR